MKLVLTLLVVILILNVVLNMNIMNTNEFFASPKQLNNLVGTKWTTEMIQKVEMEGMTIVATMNMILDFISEDKVHFDMYTKTANAINQQEILTENKETKKGIYNFNPKTKTGYIVDGENNKEEFRINAKGELEALSKENQVQMVFKKA